MTGPIWVSRWYRGAAIYGAGILLLAAVAPPPPGGALDHYGFIFTALAFQGVFWVVGGDPARFRALMPWSVAEKLAFGLPCLILVARGSAHPINLVFGIVDLVLGAGFLLAWRATPQA